MGDRESHYPASHSNGSYAEFEKKTQEEFYAYVAEDIATRDPKRWALCAEMARKRMHALLWEASHSPEGPSPMERAVQGKDMYTPKRIARWAVADSCVSTRNDEKVSVHAFNLGDGKHLSPDMIEALKNANK